jgi:hypothetical protein
MSAPIRFETDAEFTKAHPRKEWERGYCTSRPTVMQSRYAVRPALYTAFRNRETSEVHYLHGREMRTASPSLARRFKGMRYS